MVKHVFRGQIIGNKKAKGVETYLDGSVYQGIYNPSDETYHGKGRLTKWDYTYYDGEWKRGQRDGIGEEQYADGSIYVGPFKEDKRDGENGFI
jgi:hypothetical protein